MCECVRHSAVRHLQGLLAFSMGMCHYWMGMCQTEEFWSAGGHLHKRESGAGAEWGYSFVVRCWHPSQLPELFLWVTVTAATAAPSAAAEWSAAFAAVLQAP